MNWWKKDKPRNPSCHKFEATVNLEAQAKQLAKDNWVECRQCGHIVNKYSCGIVERQVMILGPDCIVGPDGEKLIYCKNCLPPYGRIRSLEEGDRYYKWIEVDKNGKPIKPKAKSV